MANFDAQVVDLIGDTLDQAACDQWAVDGAREIIMQLPASLQERCSEKTTVTSATALDLDTASYGRVLYCTRNNGSYDIPCRLVSSVYAHLTEDSTATNYYAVADDPAYFIRDNKVEIKPNPDGNGGNFYYIVYPTSINVSDVSSIANFPIECEYLLVLYVAIRQLFQYQSTMSSSWNSDITTALGAITTELNKADDIINTAHTKVGVYYTDIAELENADLWDDTNKRFDEVKLSLENAMSLIGFTTTGDKYNASYDLEANMADIDTELTNEDVELASARMQQAQTQMNAVSSHLSTAQTAMAEITSLTQKHSLPLAGVPQYMSTASGYISQAAGYVSEAVTRLQLDTAQYQWYGDQYVRLSGEYAKGLAALKEI